jgi:centractin
MVTNDSQNVYVGDTILKYKGVLKLSYPVEHGIIVNMQDMELLWRHVFDNLKVSPKEHPVLLTEAPLNPFSNRKAAAELFFERFQSPSIFF